VPPNGLDPGVPAAVAGGSPQLTGFPASGRQQQVVEARPRPAAGLLETALIVRCLEHGPRRFSEPRVPLRRVTPKVLTQSLRSLERSGLVKRTVYAEAMPHVEYELTPLGRSMLEPLATACARAEEHWDELLDAQASFDDATRVDHSRGRGRRRPHAATGGACLPDPHGDALGGVLATKQRPPPTSR
jgi:DNA-binding HxlR family transcriptional regulator